MDGGLLPIDELMGAIAVESINLDDRGLGARSANIIGACIAGNRHLRKLDLSANNLGGEGSKALAPAIRVSPASITSIGKDGLNLKGNGLGNEGWGAIFAAVCSSEASKITSVDASREQIGPEGAKLIGQALRNSVNASLSQVLAFSSQYFAQPSSFYMAYVCVQVDLALNDIGGYYDRNQGKVFHTPEGPKAVSDALRVSTSVTSVDLSWNMLGAEGAKLLAPAIRDNSVTSVRPHSELVGPGGISAH